MKKKTAHKVKNVFARDKGKGKEEGW